MKTMLSLLLFVVAGAALAAPDADCLSTHYNQYIDQHNLAFMGAAAELEQRSPEHYALLSEFIDYQIRSNILKADAVAYLSVQAPQHLELSGGLARIAPEHDKGGAHRIMLANQSYRERFPQWREQTDRLLQRSSFNDREWQEFVAARNVLNRLLSATPQYPAVIKAYRTPIANLCRIR